MILDALCEFDQQVFRTVQATQFDFDEFDDLSADENTRQYAHQKSGEVESKVTQDVFQHYAIDYVFARKKSLATRYSDGSYPIWYGSTDINTSLHESMYHWHRTYILAPRFNLTETDNIKSLRTVFTLTCRAALIDLRNKAKNDEKLIDPNPSSYSYTQKIGARIKKEGHPGLITLSARNNNGENIVVFNKNILSNPSHYKNYLFEYDIKHRTTKISEHMATIPVPEA